MQVPVQVAFQGLPVSDAIQAECWREAEKLEKYYDRITGCRIVLAQPHRRQSKGNLYSIRIDLTVPGGELVVDREPPAHRTDEDLEVGDEVRFAEERGERGPQATWVQPVSRRPRAST